MFSLKTTTLSEPIDTLEARQESHLIRALLTPAITLHPRRTGKTTDFSQITHLLKGTYYDTIYHRPIHSIVKLTRAMSSEPS
ncbi:uncharacterized protein J3R85_015032 [Psidium guajava]|nr:uncharacterized protein J3R85_015032 [Psidium guajava]